VDVAATVDAETQEKPESPPTDFPVPNAGSVTHRTATQQSFLALATRSRKLSSDLYMRALIYIFFGVLIAFWAGIFLS
jgi:hypothetical protein